MVKLNIEVLAVVLTLTVACGGSDDALDANEDNVVDECKDQPLQGVNDKRSLYAVTTLTEAFDGSGGLTVDSAGFIYVADFGDELSNANGNVVSRIDPETGVVSTFATGLQGPSGNTFSPAGKLVQANIRGNFISEINADGEVRLLNDEGFRAPVGVAFDSQGNLFVCNCGGSSIQKVTPDGTSTEFVRTRVFFNCPNGLTVDENDNLYVANFGNSAVTRIKPDSNLESLASIPGGGNAHITYGNGVLYVLSRGGNRLYELTLDGELSLIAGTGCAGNDDGSGEEATFFIPNGIGLSNDGTKIYVVSRLVGEGSPLNPVVVRVVQLK